MAESFDPLAFLELARELADGNPGEAALRTAIGRAYYGLFLTAREKTNTRGTNRVHARVVETVRSRTGFRAAGEQLDALRRLRTVADYDLSSGHGAGPDWRDRWLMASALAGRILPRLQSW